MSNQTIDGVPRAWLEEYESLADLTSGDAQMLRALLDAPAKPAEGLEADNVKLAADRAALSAELSAELETLRKSYRNVLVLLEAAQPQGEPVAWANWKVGSRSYVPYRTVGEARRCVEASEISATQNGPYRVVPLYAEQPAPVAVVLPEREDEDDPYDQYKRAWNACIDELKRLNPSM